MSVHVPVGFFELLLNVKASLCFAPGFYHPGSTTVNPLAIAYFCSSRWIFLFFYPSSVSPGFSSCSTAKS